MKSGQAIKFFNPAFIMAIAALGLCVTALCGCEGRPARKKLPDLASFQGWEDLPLQGTETQPFLISDTVIMQGSKLAGFLSVAMPDPMYDSLAISIATSYEPLAATLIEQWAKHGNKGFLIDLRSKGNEAGRADFLVTKTLPDQANIRTQLVFIWDQASAYRADYLMKAMVSMPEIKCDLISSSNEIDGRGRNDCFSPTAPSFDDQ